MQPDQASQLLAAERTRLLHQLGELGASENGDLLGDLEFGESFADAAAITSERTEVLGLVDNLKRQLADVEEAIVKVKAGTYGRCEECGNEISEARLAARPMSRYCVNDQLKRG